jgi:uncharacterized protein (DUF1697 family)
MADLRSMLEKINFHKIATYIQSGNVVFNTAEKDSSILEHKISRAIQHTFGFDVPVLVKSKTDFVKILEKNPYGHQKAIEENRVYFVLLKNVPAQERVKTFEKEVYPNEKFVVTKECVYLLCQNGYGKAKLDNNRIEGKLKVEATTRNYRTMVKLMEMCQNQL